MVQLCQSERGARPGNWSGPGPSCAGESRFYTRCMFGVLHRSFIWTIVAALIASGATWRQCIAEHLPAASGANAQHSHEQHLSHAQHVLHEQHSQGTGHHEHHQHHDGGAAKKHVPDDTGPPARGDHACLKCCSFCTVSSMVPASPRSAAIFAMSVILFAVEHDRCSDQIILIDPGIPKRIA
jgi:hypothetical protein